ncbi:MAG: hypothetical protein ACP5NW_00545 [Candidatus Woesearchaeota archaeon]
MAIIDFKNVYTQRALKNIGLVATVAGSILLGYHLASREPNKNTSESGSNSKDHTIEYTMDNKQIQIDIDAKKKSQIHLYDIDIQVKEAPSVQCTPAPKTKPSKPYTQNNNNNDSKITDLQRQVSDLEKKLEDRTIEQKEPETPQAENYQSQNFNINDFRPITARERRDACFPNNVLVNGSMFYNSSYGLLSYRGPSATSRNTFMFLSWNTGRMMPITYNQFVNADWRIMNGAYNIDENTYYNSGRVFPAVRHTTRPSYGQRAAINNAIFGGY